MLSLRYSVSWDTKGWEDFFLSFLKWIINTLLHHPIDELSILCDYKQCLYLCSACVLSNVRLFATPWTAARQAPLSMRFSRQEHWSGLPFPPPGDLSNPGLLHCKPIFFLPSEPPGKPKIYMHVDLYMCIFFKGSSYL